ncbi:uncharacterized protein LOC104899234 [Beta vulgaris subsp. vulgaris]|uniref:uncharacterized protein LOC104899234 n=1 Tax=Beta vulgaris subsp. vulgaris TaxID=3555 RepID=UPI00053FAF73|nr:uncharacterized protein LOC104899234 [Beta vulgaris subsp. vulgaris]
MPTCKYDGKTDPQDHISAYEGHMLLYTANDSVWCKVFPSTLIGLAQTWFKSIPPATVFEFRQLTSMLVTRFVNNKCMEKTTGELMSIKQEDSESLRDYVGRFNAEVITIPSLQQELAVLALMTGLKEGTAFRSYLGPKNLTSLTKVLGKANDFIRGEQFNKAAAAKRPAGDEKEEEKDRREDNYRKDKKLENFDRREESNSVKKGQEGGTDRYRNYTPLTLSGAEIYELHKKDDKWQRPRKMYNKGRDKSKWCEFHRDYGQITDDCKDLKDDIEDMITRVYFTKYLVKVDQKSPSKDDENGYRKLVKERIIEIHVISGGPTREGSIHGAKASLKEVRHK